MKEPGIASRCRGREITGSVSDPLLSARELIPGRTATKAHRVVRGQSGYNSGTRQIGV